MVDINHLALAREFGARVSKIDAPGFGFFQALKTVEHGRRVHVPAPASVLSGVVDARQDALIVRAFEDTRQGLAPDVVLADPDLARVFYARCVELGVTASDEAVFRRLMRYRKNKSLGVVLKGTTESSGANPGPFLDPVEIAWSQIVCRYGASVDDLLVNHRLANEFVALCSVVSPGGRPKDYVTAALYLRKTRHFSKPDVAKLGKIDLGRLEPKLKVVGTFDIADFDKIEHHEGLFLISEKVANSNSTTSRERSLFVGGGHDLREQIRPFETLRPFRAIANQFWTPRPDRTLLRIAPLGKELESASARLWELKLINARKPLFNMPVEDAA